MVILYYAQVCKWNNFTFGGWHTQVGGGGTGSQPKAKTNSFKTIFLQKQFLWSDYQAANWRLGVNVNDRWSNQSTIMLIIDGNHSRQKERSYYKKQGGNGDGDGNDDWDWEVLWSPCIRQDLFCKAGDIYQDIDTFYSLLFPNAKVGNKIKRYLQIFQNQMCDWSQAWDLVTGWYRADWVALGSRG